MNKETIKILEFYKILGKVKENCKTEKAKLMYEKINFFSDENSLINEFKVLDEFVSSIYKGFDYEIIEIPLIDKVFDNIRNGNILSIEEFILVYKIIQESYNFNFFLSNNHKLFDNFIKFFKIEFINFDFLKYNFQKIFDEEFNVKDNASDKLKDLRIEIKRVEKDLSKLIASYFKNPNYIDILASDNYIIKNNKFLIPVKPNFKNKLKGVIQDISSSGKTFFIETYEMLEINNKLFDLKSDELIEINRILRELTNKVFNEIENIERFLNQYYLFDYYHSKALYCYKNRWEKASVSYDQILLKDLYHPFIKDPVKNSIFFKKEKPIVIISGPNTGGKSVLLKSIGLASLLFQAGFYIPCGIGSKLPIFDNIFIDCGDEQSIDKSLSTFSSHLIKIKEIIEESTEKSLILIDEIGTGTSPQEGEALSLAIIEKLKEKNAFVFISSHFEKVKMLGFQDPKINTCSMRFDLENLKPLYIFQNDIFGQSFAIEIAKKLGISEDIINNAKSLLNRKFDYFILKNIEQKVKEYDDKNKELSKYIEKYNILIKELESLKQKYEKNFEQIKKEFVGEFYNEFKEFKKDIESKISQIKKEGYKKEKSKEIFESFNFFEKEKINNLLTDKFDKIDEKYFTQKEFVDNQFKNIEIDKDYNEENIYNENKEEKEILKEKEKFNKIAKDEFKIGDMVFIKSLKERGKIIDINGDKIKIAYKNFVFDTIKDNLIYDDYNYKIKGIQLDIDKPSVKFEIDIRGLKVFEARVKLEEFLDKAILSNYEKIYVIHGRGDGILSKFVWDFLKDKNFVKDYHYASLEEGGTGCTIVYLK